MDEKPNNKGNKLIVITAILFIISLGLGAYGLYLDKFVDKEYNIDYSYYINKKLVKNMPGEEDSYEFQKYKCNNGITGKWSKNNWKFVANANDDGKCNLYFVDKKYTVDLIAPDGITIAGQDKIKVKKDTVAEFNIALSEGVSVKEVTCTNDQKAEFTNEKVTLSELTDDTTCTLVTEDAKYNVEAKAINGKVTGYKQEVVYGQNVIYTISPTSGYSLDSVTCTNNQTGSWSNGKLTVEKVTAETVCTVTFKASEYTVIVKPVNGVVTGAKSKSIAANGTVSFTVSGTNTTTAPKVTCTNGQQGSFSNNNFTVTKVTANTTCTLNFPTS